METKYPKISVIVPVYNVEKYLPRCIDSILAQTFTDFELLLIDDGSKDKSGEICDEYAKKDNRIRVFHNTNNGASAARNWGLDKATGEYISFIDSDDWIENTFYYDFFPVDKFNYDIYFQNYICHYADGTTECKDIKAFSAKNGEIGNAILYLMKEKKFGWTWIKLFKSSIIAKHNIRFDKDISLHEDEIFTLQYCKHIKSLYIQNKSNYHYYIYTNSLTRRFKDPITYIKISLVLKEASSFIKAAGIDKYIKSRHLENLFNAVISTYRNRTQNGYDKRKRYFVVNTFLSYYFSHKNLYINYKSSIAKYTYSLLWASHSPKFIDLIMQMCFLILRKLK